MNENSTHPPPPTPPPPRSSTVRSPRKDTHLSKEGKWSQSELVFARAQVNGLKCTPLPPPLPQKTKKKKKKGSSVSFQHGIIVNAQADGEQWHTARVGRDKYLGGTKSCGRSALNSLQSALTGNLN